MSILHLVLGKYNVQIYFCGFETVSCPRESKIVIQNATYGSSKYNCYLPNADTIARVKQACNSWTCSNLCASDAFFNNKNPCPDFYDQSISKVINITYTCTMGKLFQV